MYRIAMRIIVALLLANFVLLGLWIEAAAR